MFNHQHLEDSFLTFSTCPATPEQLQTTSAISQPWICHPQSKQSVPASCTTNQSNTICNKWVQCAKSLQANNLKWVHCAQSSEANFLQWLFCAQSSQSHRIKWVQSRPTHKCVQATSPISKKHIFPSGLRSGPLHPDCSSQSLSRPSQ